jgi:hypothetical protein
MKKNIQVCFIALSIVIPGITFSQEGKGHIFNSSAVVNSKPILFNDISFNSAELLAANFQYANKDNTQKAVLKPFGFADWKQSFWKDTKLNLTQKSGITTIGAGLSFDNTAAYNKKRISRIIEENPIDDFSCPVGKTKAHCDSLKEEYRKNILNPGIIKVLQARVKNSFSITAGYNISLFEIVGGDKVLNDDSLIANQYNTKAHSFSIDISYAFSERTGISVGTALQRKRKASTEGEKMINYRGVNFTFSSWLCALDKDYKTSDNYAKNLFASSLYWGFSLEYVKAIGDSKYFEDGIKYQYIFTPFLDFRISPKSQFRVGIPIRKFESVNKNQVGFGPFLQYALQLEDKS